MKTVKQGGGALAGLGFLLEGAQVVRTYSLLAFVSCAVFGSLHIANQPDAALGYIEWIGAGIFLGNVCLLQSSRAVQLARFVFLVTVLAFLVVMLVTGGTNGTGAFWFFVFPVAAFFLTGERRGLEWMVALCVVIGVVWFLASNGTLSIAYDAVTLRQLLVSVLIVSLGIYAYQRSLEQSQRQSQESKSALRTERLRADEIVQHIGEGIVTTDADGRVTFMNEAAERMLQWPAAELQGKRFVDVVPLVDKAGNAIPARDRPLQRILRKGEPLTLLATYRAKDGSPVPVSATGTPLIVNGNIVGGIGTFRDISEEQNVVRAKSEFITLASHQLRTPISAIAWLSELLLNGDAGKLTADQRAHIADIYRSNQRMGALVSEMLLVSSLDLGSLPVIPEPVDLPKLAHMIVKEQVTLRKSRIAVTEQYDPDPLLTHLLFDPAVVKLLLRNLLSNALKYTPPDGQVTIMLAIDWAERLRPDSQGNVVIKISDTGYGIPEDATDKIFTKFFRASNIMHKDTDGTGLGLYIVKSVLDYVGGRVTFRSHEGQGTTLTILLPLEGMTKHEPQRNSIGRTTHQGMMTTKGKGVGNV